METKKFIIELEVDNATETEELINLVRSYNLQGLIIYGQKKKYSEGEMASPELTNILTVLLSCSALSISLKGLFDLLKTQLITKRNKRIKIKYKKYEIELQNFDSKELEKIMEVLNK